MTDKQIIIDGVDVSGCEYLWKANNLHCTPNRDTCKNIHNCYYKQLDQLKAENKELKKELQKYKDNEQQEKEMQKLYNKFNGNSLIEKRSPNERI